MSIEKIDPPRIIFRNGSDIRPRNTKWTWKDWIPSNKLTIVAGHSGAAKTTIVLQFAAIVTTGGNWPDGSPYTDIGRVLMWSGEDDLDDVLVPRMLAYRADMSLVEFITVTAIPGEELRSFDPSIDIPILRKELERHPDTKLLIVDPITRVVSGDMHKGNDVRKSLEQLVHIAQDYHITVIGITHVNKGSSGQKSADRITGSLAFAAIARSNLVAAKQEGSDEGVLTKGQINLAPDDGGFTYHVERCTFSYEGEEIHTSKVVWDGEVEGSSTEILKEYEEPQKKMKCKDLLEDYLGARGWVPYTDVWAHAKEFGFSESQLDYASRHMNSGYTVEKQKEGFDDNTQWWWKLETV